MKVTVKRWFFFDDMIDVIIVFDELRMLVGGGNRDEMDSCSTGS